MGMYKVVSVYQKEHIVRADFYKKGKVVNIFNTWHFMEVVI